jgi:hypothetical protein
MEGNACCVPARDVVGNVEEKPRVPAVVMRAYLCPVDKHGNRLHHRSEPDEYFFALAGQTNFFRYQ